MAEHQDRGYVVFPFQLDELELFGALEGLDGNVECRARIRLIGDELVDSDLDVVDGEGRAHCRFHGWKDRRFDVPARFLRFLQNPLAEMLSGACPEGHPMASGSSPCAGYRLHLEGFPEDFFTAHGGVWQMALAHLILGREERRSWRELPADGDLRLDWLLSRLVAKDAIRGYLQETHALDLTPADIEIRTDDDGRLRAVGAFRAQLPEPLVVEISHPDKAVVAARVGEGSLGEEVTLVVNRTNGNQASKREDASRAGRGTISPAGGGDEWSLSIPIEPIGE